MSTARLNNFSTLQYAEALKSAGVPDARAKAQAQALDRALWEAGFATYEGIKDFRRTSRKPPPQFMLGVMVAFTAIYAAIVKLL